VSSVREVFEPQTLVVKDTECNTLSNKGEVLLRWSEYYEKHLQSQDGMDNDSGEEWTLCVQTEEPNVELPNGVDKGMAISKFKNGKRIVHDHDPGRIGETGRQMAQDGYLLNHFQNIGGGGGGTRQKWEYGIICPHDKVWGLQAEQ